MTTHLTRQSLLSLPESGNATPSVLRRADRWARQHSLLLIGLTMVAAFSWPEYAARIFTPERTLHVTSLHRTLDFQTIALAIIILAASIRCAPSDFTRVFRSRAGVTSLFTIYCMVPLVTTAVAMCVFQAAAGGELRGVGLGLLLIAAMPVATTAAVWTRASSGSVPLSLGIIALTSLLAVFILPPVLTNMGAVPGAQMAASFESIRAEVIIAFAVPLLAGTGIRSLAPSFAKSLEPILSIASMVIVLAFIADTAAALRPQIAQHRNLIAVTIPITVFTNVLALGSGYLVSRMRKLSHEDTIAVVFGSSMRSVPTALAVAALVFPATPIVALPAILWSVTQQLLGGLITGRIVKAREAAVPVRRNSMTPARKSTPAPIIEASLEDIPPELEETILRPFHQTSRVISTAPANGNAQRSESEPPAANAG